MLPPQSGSFQDREDLIKYVRDFGANQGYVVTIKKSRKDRRVILGCDRGGVYRNRRKIDESNHQRKVNSRLINCPFEAIGKKKDDIWTLNVKNGEHNHEPLQDMSEHPNSRRFTEEEIREIKLMTDAGIKPRQVLKALKQRNPELQSTPRHLYNLKAKIRLGSLSDKTFKLSRSNQSVGENASVKENYRPLKVPNFIGGKFLDSCNSSSIDVINPATQDVVCQVPLSTREEFKAAVNAAKQAFPSWNDTPITTRQQIMFKFQELIRRDIGKIATNIAMEQGKALKDAQSDVLQGLEVMERACRVATSQMGEFIPNASNGIDLYYIRGPLGVCAGICASNYPETFSLWMFPTAVTCGNTFILKSSERNPGASLMIAELAMEAGLPDGVLNIIHGTHNIVDYICDDEEIKAISFVGTIAKDEMDIYVRAAASGKRVQSYKGSKNYSIIMPDASKDACLDTLVASGFSVVGQRCMALTVVVFVGGSITWLEELVERAKILKVTVGTDHNADLGPVNSVEARDQICRLIQNAIESGATLLLDGRDIVVPGYEKGNFIGPTILSDVTSTMEFYKEEIYGPVLLCMKTENLEEAIATVNRSNNGITASIFTTSGVAARKFQNEVQAGVVGVNVPVTWSFPFFNGSNALCSGGDSQFYGKSCLEFYTQVKTVVQQWKDFPSDGASFCGPSSSKADTRSLHGASGLPSTSRRELHLQRTSLTIPPESEMDPTIRLMPPISSGSDSDLSNSGASSESPLLLPLPSENDHSNQIISPTIQRHETISHVLERINLPYPSRKTDLEGLIAAKSHDKICSTTSQANKLAPFMAEVPHLSDSCLFSPPDRPFLPSISHRNEHASRSQKTETGIHPNAESLRTGSSTSERTYLSPIIHRNIGLPSSSDRLCIPTPAATSNRIDYLQDSVMD